MSKRSRSLDNLRSEKKKRNNPGCFADVAPDTMGYLGRGAYGIVVSIKTPTDSSALKLLHENDSFNASLDLIREIFGLSDAGLLKGIIVNKKRVGILMPLYDMPLATGNNLPFLCPGQAHTIFSGIAKSLSNSSGMHRDIKPSNIVIRSEEPVAKLIDFSLSTKMAMSTDSAVVTLWWRAPEVLLDFEYTAAVDVWAFGVSMLNVLTGCHISRTATEETESAKMSFAADIFDKFGWPDWPRALEKLEYYGYKKGSSEGLFNFVNILNSHETATPEKTKIASDFLRFILQTNPMNRPSWAEVLRHEFWTLIEPVSINAEARGTDTRNESASAKRRVARAELFLKNASYIPDPEAFTTNKFTWQTNLIVMDHLLYYGRRLRALDTTIFKAFSIWRSTLNDSYSTIQGSIYYIASCLMIAMAYNEDIRVQDISWQMWSLNFDEPEGSVPFFKDNLNYLLKATMGHWPTDTLEARVRMVQSKRPENYNESQDIFLSIATNEDEIKMVHDNLLRLVSLKKIISLKVGPVFN